MKRIKSNLCLRSKEVEVQRQTKMKNLKHFASILLPLFLSVNLMLENKKCLALADVSQTSTATSQKMADGQQLQQNHNPMSCYVCSTMDYENTADNLCRVMKPHHRPGNFHQQPPNLLSTGHHHSTSTMGPASTTTTTSSTAAPFEAALEATDPSSSPLLGSTNPNVMSTQDAYASTSSYYDESTTIAEAFANHHTGNTSQNHNDSQLVNGSMMARPHHGYFPQNQHRAGPPSNYIRTRQCLEDENFCSIVSVVRIEVVNDSLLSRFWAMERNCSKSCNTGCMLIGERVRLRVCSQCCRTPNCNVRSKALTIKSASSLFHVMLLSLLSMALIRVLAEGSNSTKLRE